MRGINFKSDFCENFFNTSTSIATEYKINFLKKLIRNDTIYKFIQFNDNEDLNYVKLSLLKNQSLWFSHSRFLNDDTEYEITYSSKKVLNKLKSNNFNQDSLNMFIGALQDVYELCSFTYESTPYMWETYSNKDNGICIEFKVCDYDQLYPVIYAKKSKVDFNKLISDSINNNTMNPRSFFE